MPETHIIEPLDLVEARSVLARTPLVVRTLVEGLSADSIRAREAPNTWNAFEVLCHLADGEISDWIPRVAIILNGGDDKRFRPFDREGGLRRYAGWSMPQLLQEFEMLRRNSLTKLDGFRIGPEHLQLHGIHPEFGAVTLEQLLACWVTHDHAHIAQISRVLVRHFGQRVGPWTKYFSLLKDRSTVG